MICFNMFQHAVGFQTLCALSPIQTSACSCTNCRYHRNCSLLVFFVVSHFPSCFPVSGFTLCVDIFFFFPTLIGYTCVLIPNQFSLYRLLPVVNASSSDCPSLCAPVFCFEPLPSCFQLLCQIVFCWMLFVLSLPALC